MVPGARLGEAFRSCFVKNMSVVHEFRGSILSSVFSSFFRFCSMAKAVETLAFALIHNSLSV